MSDQPSGKVSAQKPASAHLKTVLINTVVPSHFCQDYRRVQAGQLPGCGHLVLVSRLAQQRSHPLDERLALQQPAMRRGLKGVCRSPRQSLLDEPPVGRLGIVAARLATPGRMQSLVGHPSNAPPPAVVARIARPGPVARVEAGKRDRESGATGKRDRKAGQVRYWQYGQAENSPHLAISDLPASFCPASFPLPVSVPFLCPCSEKTAPEEQAGAARSTDRRETRGMSLICQCTIRSAFLNRECPWMRPLLQSGHGVAAARQGIGRATRIGPSDGSQVVAGWKKGRSEFLILAVSPFLLPDQQGDRRPPVHRQQPWRCKDRV